jgi:hypothetical protein
MYIDSCMKNNVYEVYIFLNDLIVWICLFKNKNIILFCFVGLFHLIFSNIKVLKVFFCEILEIFGFQIRNNKDNHEQRSFVSSFKATKIEFKYSQAFN